MNRQSRGDWESDGARDMATRAAEETSRILDSHIPQRLDDNILTTLAEIKKRGEKEILSQS
jgi:trimethylamine:corrinoid methyltransferase-like protein